MNLAFRPETLALLDKGVKWGALGKGVYERTYSRVKEDGTKETWPETVLRVVNGNCALVPEKYIEPGERNKLFDLIYNFKILPGGRHLWASGVKGRQFLFNCVSAGFFEDITEHFAFLFAQLMQGSGVGTNYSNRYIERYTSVQNAFDIHFVCASEHTDYAEIKELLSVQYSPDWEGSITIQDSREGWVEALTELIRRHFSPIHSSEPLVFDVSGIRPKGIRIKTFGGVSSGPQALMTMLQQINNFLNQKHLVWLKSTDYMQIDHLIASCVIAGNVRRSARMAIKSWKDEDVLEFIACKQDGTSHWTANISVEVDDAFFAAWKRKDEWAKKVFDASVKAMLDNGEPGFWNVSRNRDGEPDPEEVFSCNPCGEITLHPNENCNLGHVNIGAYADESAKEAFRLMTRFLIRATFGDITDERQKRVVAKNRRIGVGFFGFQSWLVANGIKFSESHANLYVKECLRQWYLVVREEAQKYCYQLRIPECVKVTTIAPTGTTALLPGQTTGIQPIYARYAIRRVRYADNDPSLADLADHRIEDCIYSKNTKVVYFYYKDSLVDYAEKIWKNADLVEDQSEIHLADMLAVQAMIQAYYCDNAVSFTANILPDSLTFRELKSLLINYLPRLKGTTIMVDSTRAQAPYERISKNEFEMHESTVSQGEMECATGACPIR